MTSDYGVPIFDSITHPSIAGNWFGKDLGNTFDSLRKDLVEHNFAGACAVSLPPVSEIDLVQFYKACVEEKTPFLYPVAAFNFDEQLYEDKIQAIVRIGYKAIKIHPRLSGISMDDDLEKLEKVFTLCEANNLIVFFCTYCYSSIDKTPEYPITHYIIKLLKITPKLKIILLHGGDVNLLQLSQLARFNPNVLIDLSYTMIKFKGSSVDTDIEFLMNHLDQRICIGSDYPDYSIAEFKSRVDFFRTKIIDENKFKQICAGNIISFLNIQL